ncbi:MAG: acyl-CoA/acyl-ACP dehydrogenase [Fuerstiella sp.]|nr:acyl-CoA/acyl-ACP dehydrogenase [Fuerstiella sp.]
MSSLLESEAVQSLLSRLAATPCSEAIDDWPADRLQALNAAGVMKWNLPGQFGGLELDDVTMLDGYRVLSSACLVTTFILTQRNAACQRIVTSQNSDARESLLPELADGRLFATVGISHLTTSGQHLATPAVRAEPSEDGFRLSGVVPWATGAAYADVLVTGGQLTDGRQLLAAIPTDRDGLHVNEPVKLMALSSSQTGSVQLTNVEVRPEEILHGPVPAVMRQATGGGAGSLGTSTLAVGAADGMLRHLRTEMNRRPDLSEFVEPLSKSSAELVDQIHRAALSDHWEGPSPAEVVRRQANSLVLRTAQVWLAATKGAGYVAGHAAERAVRESMFFLVWSCPQPVLSANLRELTCVSHSADC